MRTDDDELPPALRNDTTADRAARFGCGALLGLVVALGTLVPVGLVSIPGLALQLVPTIGALVYVLLMAAFLGALTLWRGERFIEGLLRLLRALEDPFRRDR